MLDHHPEDPYKVNNIFEAAQWISKGTNMSTGLAKPISPTPGLITNPAITIIARTPAPVKTETLDTATNAIISMLAHMEEHMTALLDTRNNGQSHAPHTLGDSCHFCGKVGHTMVRGNCLVLEAFIQQGKVQQNVEGKVVLSSSTMISNYAGKHLYHKCIDEWHCLNPGQIVTGCLTSTPTPTMSRPCISH